jgi:hypothetical protein
MKQRLDQAVLRRSGAMQAMAGLALLSAGLSGCASTTVDQAKPMASTALPAGAAATTDAAALAATSTGQPKDTGSFPNLNVAPQAGAPQISPEDKQAHVNELRAAQQGLAATTASNTAPADQARLRKLAATHADDALKAIENEK